jgi:hypothetical protein
MFDELASLADDPDRLMNRAAQTFASTGDLHRLFDLRLMQERLRLGLALDRRTPIDEIDEPIRSQLEAGYLEACREVGELLVEAGRLREAWMYLRPAGEKPSLRRHLACIAADEAQADELIELALYEGVDPERGFAWLLGRQGTCSGITTLDGLAEQLSLADLTACAAVLVRHVYNELRGNLRGHLQRLTEGPPPDASVRELITQHPELQSQGDFHLDASHLTSAMKYARLLTEPALVDKALEMAEYGSRLPAELQYAGEPPFEDVYPAHRRWFEATLGRDADAALGYFAEQAGREVDNPLATAAVEAYLELLVRVGRPGDALDAAERLVPADRQLSRHAPTLLELAEQSGQWSRYAMICEARNDVLGFTAGLLAQRQQQARGL